jgi:hypothetical protein
MSQILERAKKQFREKISGSGGLLSISVPEWQDEQGRETVIYFKPASTLMLKDFSKLLELVNKSTVESAVDIIILRALDDKGRAMFKTVERTEFMREIDPTMILKIMSMMGEKDTEWMESYGEKTHTLVEIAEKN